MTSPAGPIVARKANASVTPPNWASTPHADVIVRRRTPFGLPVAMAYARTAPTTAPMTALTTDSSTLFLNDWTT